MKVDLILYNDQLGDVSSCEDKPTNATDADIRADVKKVKELREKLHEPRAAIHHHP